ncbi:hypothetical protein I7I50_03122 [Histoplasma capsulatum G186AR]|uniref:Uncharacterized protein n=1 Tax=Ajellomyces capsulatus TaxID=5037 RepID=A0A8H7Z7I1_AJECA|nr:hypothetical protein I7I52_00209 [Histoplasma capsulatum]QSS72066.1 hypothetical protein I7I50_03122 [Histoplasma capsulatum G186AR]
MGESVVGVPEEEDAVCLGALGRNESDGEEGGQGEEGESGGEGEGRGEIQEEGRFVYYNGGHFCALEVKGWKIVGRLNSSVFFFPLLFAYILV